MKTIQIFKVNLQLFIIALLSTVSLMSCNKDGDVAKPENTQLLEANATYEYYTRFYVINETTVVEKIFVVFLKKVVLIFRKVEVCKGWSRWCSHCCSVKLPKSAIAKSKDIIGHNKAKSCNNGRFWVSVRQL